MGLHRCCWPTSFTLLVLIILVFCPPCLAKNERSPVSIVQDRDMNKRREACYHDIDNGLWGTACRSSQIARENCSLRCVSTACYSTIYEDDPLEAGEIDIKRGRDFRHCLRRAIQEEKLASKHWIQ